MKPAVRPSVLMLAIALLAACATTSTGPITRTTPPQRATGAVAGAVDMTPLREAARSLGVSPAFRGCVDAAAGAAAAQACIDAELQHQQSRIDAALAARRGQSKSNGDVDDIQAQWRSERDRICGPDAPGVPAAPRMQAGICKLEATAARADVLAR